MRLIFTKQSLNSLQLSLEFMLKVQKIPEETVYRIQHDLLARTDELISNPEQGQIEESLKSLGLEHRRLVEGHFKIIYRVSNQTIYITDFFDSRQHPKKMKG